MSIMVKERKRERKTEGSSDTNRRQQMPCLQAVVNKKSLFTIRLTIDPAHHQPILTQLWMKL
jgi:hypothetical protein